MIAVQDNWVIDSPNSTVILPGNRHDIGLIVRKNQSGFVAVDLGMGADPETFTDALVLSERMGMGGRVLPDGTVRDSWRFRKEYKRDATAASGQPVFEPEWLDWQQQHLREPAYRMDLDLTPADLSLPQARLGLPEGFRLPNVTEPYAVGVSRDVAGLVVLGASFWTWTVDDRRRELRQWLVRKANGRVAVWIDPASRPVGLPSGLESAVRTFAAGADVGEGVQQSETTCVVLTGDTREQAAEFGSSRITPGDFGVLMAAMCRYFNDALAVPVRKMHGITTIRAMLEEGGYGRIWHERRSERAIETRAEALGWAKGETSDDLLFGRWVTAVKEHRVTIHSATLWQQLGQYIYDDQGRICMGSLAWLSVEERKRHGDRAVAAALAWLGVMDLPKWRQEKPTDNAPMYSLNWRRDQRGDTEAARVKVAWYNR